MEEEMTFADIHIHILPNLDDGARSFEEACEMLDAAYAEGARLICCTPHFGSRICASDPEQVLSSFSKLTSYSEKYPDLQLCLGNELHYSPVCLAAVRNGKCMTLNGSRYLLVDFDENEAETVIRSALKRILNEGFIPVLAHAERYRNLSVKPKDIVTLRKDGVVVQVDAGSVFGGWGWNSRVRSRRLLRNHLADVIASDGHNTGSRPPELRNCYEFIAGKCGHEYARRIFCDNPHFILKDMSIPKRI